MLNNRVITEPAMVEMVKRMFKNSDFTSRVALGKLIKKQRNPFKDNFGMYIPVDDSVMIFLNDIYMSYMFLGEEDKRFIKVRINN